MRKTSSLFLTRLTLTLGALYALTNLAQAQTVIGIFDTDQTWSYYQAGNQPANIGGLTWRTNNYNDSAWSVGNGVFAYEDAPGAYPPINTFLNRTVDGIPGGTTNITYYFRTHFNFPTNPAGVILNFTNLVDDGLVLYLNGVRLYDIRVATANPVWATYSGGGPATEGERQLVPIANTPLLRQGDNVLAVELHDGGLGSSDVAFGLALGYAFLDPIVITQQPAPLTPAIAFDDIALSVEAVGSNPRYWWFRNNVFLTTQTNPVLTMNNITIGQAGTYHVVVSNAISGARSSNAVVTVVPDTFGPRILDAYVAVGETNRLLLQFNEDILRVHANTNFSVFNPTNYFVSILGRTNPTDRISIAQIIPGTGQELVRLTMVTNFNPATNYQICIKNIMDTRGNMIAWNSCVPIGFQTITNPIPLQSTWFYHEQTFEPEGNWRALNYVEDIRWYETLGAFHGSFADTNHAVCSELNWSMSVGYSAYYFRKKFVLTTNLVGIRLDATLTHAVDDGAVFYLNGNEIARYNMPPGPTTYDGPRASTLVDNDCRTLTFSDWVLPRTNILAVEVHQFNPGGVNDLDAGFEASLAFRYIPYPRLTQPTSVRIFATNHSPTHVSVYFTNGFGYAIQSKTNLTDLAWQEVQPATNRLIAPKENPRRFYRLQKVH